MSERDPRDERLDEALSALLDGEPNAATEALRARVARSPELRRRLDELARVDEMLRAVPEPAVPADLLARVRAQAEAEESGPRPGIGAPRPRRRWLVVGSALAAAAAGAALALYLGPGVGSAPETVRAPQVARVPESPGVGPLAPVPTTEPPGDHLVGLGDTSAEEILLVMELETLEDLEILELLEELES